MTEEQKEKYIASLYFSIKKDEVKKEETFLRDFYPDNPQNISDTNSNNTAKGEDDSIGQE